MNDVLIPVGMLLFLALLGYAFVASARKQRRMKSAAFRDFADGMGLRYLATDDGTAQTFALGMNGIGQFESPSLGEVIPEDLVGGCIEGLDVTLFRHSTRFEEGHAREWFVAGVRASANVAEQCSVQFLEHKVQRETMYLQDPVVEERQAGAFHVVVRSPNRASAGCLLNPEVIETISALAGELPFRPEIQVRCRCVAAYPAGRNDTVENADALARLLEFSRHVATIHM